MDEQGQELPVVELQLHGGDPLQLAAELDAENARCECRNCDGTGWWDGRLCPDCGGTGELVGDVAEIAMLRKRVAELEAAVCERDDDLVGMQYKQNDARRWAAAWKRAAKRLMSEVGILADELLSEGRCPGGGKPCMFGDGGGVVCKTHFIAYARLSALMRRSSFRRLIAECRALGDALDVERRAVESLAEHIETACDGFAHGSMSAMEVAPGGYTDATEIAAWARERAREEGGE